MANETNKQVEIATIGGGCFWCVEAVYVDLIGVSSVVSGYAGGHVVDPTYEQVCGKQTGHAEVVQITYDPAVITYREILQIFFTVHDPTTLNQQGNDIGPQYRSTIMPHDDAQHEIAKQVMAEVEAEKLWANPIVTLIEPLDVFYEADAYHQNYYARNPWEGYCMAVIRPKVNKFRKKYTDRLRKPA